MKTNKKNFLYFKKRCEFWIKFWGLIEYSYVIIHVESDDDSLAWINRDIEVMAATICLAKEWGAPITKESLNRVAFHEVFHLVLGKMSIIAKNRWATYNEFYREEEAIIRRMENVIFPIVK